ncbi:MAG TPA: alpha/beta hydrolase [Amycolatopsis sp.]|nr:alpha/beta hydrolase [Amycolatopsis sp.]
MAEPVPEVSAPVDLAPLLEPWIAALGAALDILGGKREGSLDDARRSYADFFATRFPAPPEVEFEDAEAAGVPITWARPRNASGNILLYLHGGGYLVGAPRGYRGLVGRYARALSADAVIPDYRLAPEHPYPAAIDDNVAVYRWLLDQGVAADSIVVSGDSAGGGMTVALMVAARDAGLPLPSGGVALSPWANLEHTGASMASKKDADPLCTPEALDMMARGYLGNRPLNSPLASPVFADVTGLPPIGIQIGEREIMLSDAIRLADHLAAASVRVRLDVWPGMPHVWHLFSGDLEQADTALSESVSFLRSCLDHVLDPQSRQQCEGVR